MLKDLVLKNRSYRRFHEDVKISLEQLTQLVELARTSPSAKNLQPLKFFLSNEEELNAKIFKHLAWAGYIQDWDGPDEGERPSGYIIILNDTTITTNQKWDDGIMAQSMMLGAVEMGLGGCMIGSVTRKPLKEALNIPDHFEIILVLALGKPKEVVVIDEIKNDDIKYWRDQNEIHHVPKRSLNDLIIN